MSQSDVDMDKVSFVISSGSRVDCLELLAVQPRTPTEIADECSRDIWTVSNTLGDLVDEELVELLVTEDRKKGRLYGLTEVGEDVAEYVNNRE